VLPFGLCVTGLLARLVPVAQGLQEAFVSKKELLVRSLNWVSLLVCATTMDVASVKATRQDTYNNGHRALVLVHHEVCRRQPAEGRAWRTLLRYFG
jgi:hypothetical protein